MTASCLLLGLCRSLQHARPEVDALQLVTQLGIPPNLASLVDGMERTVACLTRFSAELDACLSIVLGDAMGADALVRGIQAALDWAATQPWPVDDIRLQLMQRPDPQSPHPLSRYCLSVLAHWPNLYYALEPGDDSRQDDSAWSRYDVLMAEFSVYVLAAQATIDPAHYRDYVRTWCTNRRLPDAHLYPTTRLGSRVGNASRAVRRLTLSEHAALFHFLSDAAQGDALHDRVFRALRQPWTPDDTPLLEDIALLIEEVRPGWARPGVHSDRGHRHGSHRASPHRTFKDGFVRIPEQDAVLTAYTADDGTTVQHLQQVDDADGAAADPSQDDDERQWVPIGELGSDGDLEIVSLPPGEEEPYLGRPPNSRIASHLRSDELGLAIRKERLSRTEVRVLLTALNRTSNADVPLEAAVTLHACLSLGRNVDEIKYLEIHDGNAHVNVAANRIHYFLGSRQWIVPCPPPAWSDEPVRSIERPVWGQMFLNDHTGFYALLSRSDRTWTGQPVKHLTQARRAAMDGFLEQTLPYTNATIEKCCGYLFYRLLQVTDGDLGIASLITGQDRWHSRSVRHYAHYRARQVWNAYASAWRPRSRLESVMAQDGPGYGARHVPTVAAVQALLTFLAQQSGDTSSPYDRRHNAYTAYTLAGMVLGLAMRPLTDVRLTGVREAANAGFLVNLTDKARSEYDRRINPVPDALAKHLEAYTNYRAAIRVMRWALDQDALLLYVDPETGKATRFRPSHFKAIVDTHFPLEAYALRHFVRTALTDHNAPTGEDIDAAMGHWRFGASPLDRLSTYPMRRLRELAEGRLAQLLADVGFMPIEPPT